MAKENAVLDENQNLNEDLSDSFDFDELEEKLQSQLEDELADAVIRICDLCGHLNIDLEKHIEHKLFYNSLRDERHGKRY